MRGGWTKVGLAGAAIVALSAGTVTYFGPDRDQAAPAPAAVQPVPVIATTVEQRDVPIILTGLGTVTALNTAMVGSQVTGLLTSIDFREGQLVKRANCSPRSIRALTKRRWIRRRPR